MIDVFLRLSATGIVFLVVSLVVILLTPDEVLRHPRHGDRVAVAELMAFSAAGTMLLVGLIGAAICKIWGIA